MDKSYTKEELTKLHQALYSILSDIDRVCRANNIKYFIIGGTAIGAYFWDGIIPWDDDIDVGMTRYNYNKFLQIAPTELSKDFFLQNTATEKHYPYFFTKIRKNGTIFSEPAFAEVDMHQGVFVDVFPFDDVTTWKWGERLQYKSMHFFCEILASTECWKFNHFGKNNGIEIEQRGFLACLFARIVISIFPKSAIANLVTYIQTFFNNKNLRICKNIITKTEYIPKSDVETPSEVKFGPLTVWCPNNLLEYLNTHYGKVVKDCPEEMRVNHRPTHLSL